MKKDFDHIAKLYDQDFTHSEIGKCQRNSVYRYLNSHFHVINSKTNNILELNCGTGEDAIWLAKKGPTVLATDISEEMIEVAKQKAKNIKNLHFQALNINNLDDYSNKIKKSKKIDLIFSNFGGLNCLNPKELQLFFKNSSNLLSEKGKLILVIMPKNTLWERGYFILKLNFKKAFRRDTKKALEVNVDYKKVKTWYYNPLTIKNLSSEHFKIVKTKPIGFFIPPSYLENYFKKHKRFLSILDKMENKIGRFGFLSRFSDHYLIELELIKEKKN